MAGADFDRDPAIGFVFGVSAVSSNSLLGNLSAGASYLTGNPDAQFKSISGISATRGIEEYRPLGANNYSYKLPTNTDYSDLVLERGITKSYSDLTSWANSFLEEDTSNSVGSMLGSGYMLVKKIIIVSLYDRKNPNSTWFPLMTWTFEDAIPKSIEYSGLDSQTSGIAIEKMTIAYSKFSTLHNTLI